MLNITIFSKDRPLQLELLLRSLKTFFKEYDLADISVIYTHSGEKAATNPLLQAYQKCSSLYPEVNFLLEATSGGFKEATKGTLNEKNPFTMFLVDDIVFKDSFSILDKEFNTLASDPAVLCLSLRLYPGINYCYPINQFTPVPEINSNGTFDWTTAMGDFGYPLSLDGNIFSTEVIKLFIENLPYSNPNTLESMMSVNTHIVKHLPLMVAYSDNSKVLNVPCNRVQEDFNNRVANFASTEELNNRFLNGEVIDLAPFIGLKNASCHVELEYKFTKRE